MKEHRFRQNFECVSPECICGAAIEDTEHYLLHCPQLCTLCQTLLGQISDVGFDIANVSTKDLCCLLLYGRPNGSTYINWMTLEATISFIKSSKRYRYNVCQKPESFHTICVLFKSFFLLFLFLHCIILRIMVVFLTISFQISFSIFCILIIDIWNTNIVCVTAIVLSMGTQFVNKEEIVSGICNEDSVTLCLSSLRVLT